jgi:hypothetical protein
MSPRISTRLALLVLLAGASLPAFAQGPNPLLEISASTARRGASGSFLITLKPAAAGGIVALQWQLTVGAGVTVDIGDIMAGSAAESAQKSLTCAARERAYVCILAGGQKNLPAGTIAVIRYKVSAQARVGAATVRIEHAVGTSADTKRVEIGSAEAAITIQ